MATRIQDSTGKFIEVDDDTTNVLKNLVASLKGSTAKASKLGANNSVEKLLALTESCERDAEKLQKLVKKLPKAFVDKFLKEIGSVDDWIKDIREFSKDIQSKREKGNLNKKDLNPMERVMGAIKTATEKTERIFGTKGSGWVHDPYAEKILIKMNQSLNELLKHITSTKNTPGKTPSSTPLTASNAGGVLDANKSVGLDANHTFVDALGTNDINDVNKSLSETQSKYGGLIQDSMQMVKNLDRIRRNSSYWSSDLALIADYGSHIASEMTRIDSGVKEITEAHMKIIKQYDKENKIINEVVQNWDRLNAGEKLRLKILIKQTQDLKSQGADVEEVSKQYDKIVQASKEIVRNHHLLRETTKKLADKSKEYAMHMASIGSGLMGAKFIAGVFEGIEESVVQLNQETGLLRSLMTDKSWAGPSEYFNKMLDVSVELRQQLGQAPVLIRRAWITNLKKGVRNLEDMKRSLNDGLALATAIGSNAEATADEFQKWNMQVGMGSKQTSTLARNIRQAASSMGVMGDEMLKAVSSARELVQEMRNAGLDADKVADGVVRMQAAAQQFGVDKQFQEMIRATSSLEGFVNSSREMKLLLAQSGQAEAAVGGSAMGDPMAQKKTMMGIADALKAEFSRAGAINAEGKVDTSKLSPQQITQMDFLMRRRFGKSMGIGESKNMIEAIEKANMTVDEKMDRLNKAMSVNNNLTADEKKSMEEELKILESQKKQEQNTLLVNSLDRMSATLKESNPADAISTMQKTLETEAKNAQSRGVTLSTDITQAIQNSIGSVNERLKEAGKAQLDQTKLMNKFESARLKNDANSPREMREVMMDISKADQVASTQLKEQGDLISKAAGTQQDMQSRIQELLGKAVQFLGFLPTSILWLTAIATSLIGLGQLRQLLEVMRKSQSLLTDVKTTSKDTHDMFDHRGSGYTHDIYVVNELMKVQKILKQISDRKALGGDGKKEAFENQLSDKLKTDSKFADLHSKDPLQARKNLKNENLVNKKLTTDPKLIELNKTNPERAGMLAEAQIKEARRKRLEKMAPPSAPAATPEVPKKFSLPEFEMPKNMKKVGMDLIKGAAGLAILVTGIIALAAVIIKISGVILGLTGLDLNKAKEIGETTGVILLAAGLIATAAVGAAVGLSFLEKARSMINIGDVYKGAGFLLLLIPAMLLLSTAILGMGAVINSFIDIKEAEKIATGVTAIMKSAAIISLAAITGMLGLLALGAVLSLLSGPQFGAFLILLGLGALALLALVPAMTLMSMAIIKLSDSITANIDVNWAEGVSTKVANIMMSAAKIAGAVVLMAGFMTVMSAMSLLAPVLAPIMLLGAAGLFALTPAMVAIALAIIGIAAGVSANIDVKWAEDVAGRTANIMVAAAKIAGAVVALAGITTVLGLLSVLAPVLAPFMLLGSVGLFLLIPAMVALANSIIMLGSMMSVFMDVAAAETTAKSVAGFMESASSIVWSIVKLGGLTSVLGLMLPIAALLAILIPLGSASIALLGSVLAIFGVALVNVGELLTSQVDMQKMENSRKALESMSSMATAFGTTFDVLYKTLLPMIEKPILGLFGKSLAAKLADTINQFTANDGLLVQIVNFFAVISKKLAEANVDVSSIQLLDKLTSSGTAVINKLSAFLDSLSTAMLPWVDGWWWNSPLLKLNSKVSQFSLFFSGIGSTLSTGLIDPITKYFPTIDEVNDAAMKLDGMKKVLEKTNTTLDSFSVVMNDWASASWWSSPIKDLRNKTEDFASFFGDIGYSLRNGIIDPIKTNFPKVSEIEVVIETLTKLTESMKVLSEVLSSLSDVTQSMNGLDLSPLKIQMLQGIIGTIRTPTTTVLGDNNENPFQKKEETWWGEMLGVLTGIGSPQTSVNGGLGRIFRGSFDQSIAQPINKVGSQIGENNSDFSLAIKAAGISITEAVNLARMNIVTAIEKNKGEAVAANPPVQKGLVNSGELTDLDERVQQRVQSAKPPAAMAAANEELVKIAANSELLVRITTEQNELLQSILDKLDVDVVNQPATNEDGNNTRLNTKSKGVANYYKWNQARYGDGPNKQYTNAG